MRAPELPRSVQFVMRACIQISVPLGYIFCCCWVTVDVPHMAICEIYWNGQRVVQIVAAGFLDRSVQEQVILLLELFLQEKITNCIRFLHFYSYMPSHVLSL